MKATDLPPASPPRDLEHRVIDRLRTASVRYTGSRRAVVGALSAAPGPCTVAGLHDAIGDTLPLSSLYRTLAVLEEVGVLRRVPADTGVVGYELAEDVAGHHHHLVCDRCGRTLDIDAAGADERDLDRVAERIGAAADFVVTGHRLDLRGVCADCNR